MPRPKMPPMKKKLNVNALKRVIKILFSYYPVLLPIAIACIIFSAVTAAIPAIFNQQVIAAIEEWFVSRAPPATDGTSPRPRAMRPSRPFPRSRPSKPKKPGPMR